MIRIQRFFYVLVVCLAVIVWGGCARIQVAQEGVYPLRAQFSGTITGNDQVDTITGAAYIAAGTQAKAQIDGPGGLAAYIISIEDNRISVVDTWGRPVKSLDLPAPVFLSLLAGNPPRDRYFYRRQEGEFIRIYYAWGEVLLDRYQQPRHIFLKTKPASVIELRPVVQGIHLLIKHASVTLDFTMEILEGGRWRHD